MNRNDFAFEYPLLLHASHSNERVLLDFELVTCQFENFSHDIEPLIPVLDSSSGETHSAHLTSVLKLAAKHRIFSLSLPRSLGGSGCSMLALAIGLERLAQRCAAIANLVATHGLALALVGATGNVRWLRTLAERIVDHERRGTPYLLSTAATEPSAGSDLEDYRELGHAKLESIARPSAQGYRLTGSKIYVSNGSIADAHVVVMPTSQSRPRDTLLAFIVPKSSDGLRVVRQEHKLGQRASPATELRFDDCFVSHEQCLSERSVAGRTLDLVLGASRSVVGAFGAGIAHGVLKRCEELLLGSTSSRRTPDAGQEILLGRMWSNAQLARNCYVAGCLANATFGLVSFMESDALRRLDRILPEGLVRNPFAERLMGLASINDQARRVMSKLPPHDIANASSFGAETKVSCGELALANCELAFELLAFEATREDSGIPKFWRDARLLPIYEGTNDICLLDVTRKQASQKGAR